MGGTPLERFSRALMRQTSAESSFSSAVLTTEVSPGREIVMCFSLLGSMGRGDSTPHARLARMPARAPDASSSNAIVVKGCVEFSCRRKFDAVTTGSGHDLAIGDIAAMKEHPAT